MNEYELGKDIQNILARLENLEVGKNITDSPHKASHLSGNKLFGVIWKMVTAKSKFNSEWTPESETRLYEEIPGGYKLTVAGSAKGDEYSWGYTALYDGLDHHVYGRKDVDAIEAYRIDDRITIGFFKKNALAGGAYSRKLSADGKTLQVLASGRNSEGAAYFDVVEYEL